MKPSSVKQQISFCINNPNDFVLHFIYVKKDEVCTRAVSPYQFQSGDRFIGFCLSCEDMRSFRIENIQRSCVVSVNAVDVPFKSNVVKIDARS